MDPGLSHGKDILQHNPRRYPTILATDLFVHGLDVDVRCIEERQDPVQRLLFHITRRNEDVLEAGLMCQRGDVMHILPPGEWLGVSIGDGGKASLKAEPDHLLRSDKGGLRCFGGDLGDIAVLAPSAGKVAAGAAQGQAAGPGKEMVQGLLFDRVDGKGAWPSIRKREEFAVLAFPTAARSPSAFPDVAMMRAEQALHSVFHRLVEPRFGHHSSVSLTTSV